MQQVNCKFRIRIEKRSQIANMSRYNQSSGSPSSHTQTYRAIVVGGGGVGKSAITIQFIQVSGMQKCSLEWKLHCADGTETGQIHVDHHSITENRATNR